MLNQYPVERPQERGHFSLDGTAETVTPAIQAVARLGPADAIRITCGALDLVISLVSTEPHEQLFRIDTSYNLAAFHQNPQAALFGTYSQLAEFPAALFDTCTMKPGSLIQIGDVAFRLPNQFYQQDPFIKLRAAATCYIFGELLSASPHSRSSGQTLHGLYSAVIDQGHLRRQSNQDVVGIRITPGGQTCLVVTDGMGGYGGGDFAARCVAEATLDQVQQGTELDKALLNTSHILENRLYLDKLPETHREMGACVVAATVSRDQVAIGHIGDTRAYLIRNEPEPSILYRSRDHSRLQEALEQGIIRPEESRSYALRNIVERAVRPGALAPYCRPTIETMSIRQNDLLILCTDGLWENVHDHQILSLASAHHDPSELTQALTASALAEMKRSAESQGSLPGNDDNIGLIVYRHEW